MLNVFFRELPNATGLPANKVLFIIDGLRQAIYNPGLADKHEQSYFGLMRKHFIKIATANEYQTIDLHEVFKSDYFINKKKFEFINDNHWNGHAHGVIANAVINSNWIKTISNDN